MNKLGSAIFSRLVIIIPYAWLLFFFLIPFFIVFRISLSTTAIAMPPYEPVFGFSDGLSGILQKIGTFSFDNYVWLTEDALYFNAYISSLWIAGVSTLMTLLIGYPIAYGMAQAPRTLRPMLLMLVILPFWTSFLIRVYAWIAILKPEGMLNQLLLSIGVIDQPLIILNTNWAIYIGIVYSYLPFMVLPIYSALEKMDHSLIEAAQDLGCPPVGLLEDHLSAVHAGRDRRLHAGVHPGGRRVRHPRPARRIADADDRQDAVERVLRQSRLAGVLGGGGDPSLAAHRADHDLPVGAGARAGAVAMNAAWSRFNIVSIVLGFAFLYLPIVLLVIFSFNESKLVTVWGGFSTKWYGELFRNQGLMDAAWVTLRVGLISATVATVLGTLAALTLTRYTRFRGRILFSGMVFAPLVMPEVITGLSLLLLFVAIGLDRGFLTVTLAHITFSMCFVAVVVQSRLMTFDRSLEEAAMDLGAPPVKTFFQVTLPVIAPAIVSGWMLAFTLSLDDLVIASFTSGPGATTLPMKIYSQVRLGVTPEINAVCTLLIGVVALGVIVASLANKRREVQRQRDEQAAMQG